MPEPDHANAPIRLIPYHQSLLNAVATDLLATAAAAYDLTEFTVLLPHSLAAPALRQELLRCSGQSALLGPAIATLDRWVLDQAPAQQVLSDQASELTLVDALQDHLHLFGDDNPWRIAQALRQLFKELTQHRVMLPDSFAAWERVLVEAYGTDNPALQHEAGIVYQLWQAWQQQLRDNNCVDQATAYQQALAYSLNQPHEKLFLIGIQAFTAAELDWIRHKLASGQLTWFIQASSTSTLAEQYLQPFLDLGQLQAHATPTAISHCLAAVFPQDERDLQQRAHQCRESFAASPLLEHYHCLTADNPEQEARAIDLQVRQWLLAGKTCIGIITEDRRLARRVRALMERAGVPLQDSGGWALSTTTAAAAAERWLECIEEDFAYLPLLDLLKSQLLLPDQDHAERLQAVYRFEQDIVLHENISRNLTRYSQHLAYRERRLQAEESQRYATLRALLTTLADAAESLQALLSTQATAAEFLEALRQGLEALGIWQSWEGDAAGLRLISLWDSLSSAAQQQTLTLDWPGFRAWWGGNVERTTFRPAQTGGPVQLLTLEQSQGQQFDALVIGGCDAEHLPSKPSVSPFFNDVVRHELGLPTWQANYHHQLYHFRRVLEAAPQVLLTWHKEDQGDPVLPSPWLDALLTLHELSYGSRLPASTLQQQLNQAIDVESPFSAPLPTIPEQPRPTLPAVLQPKAESPSSHQQLINCPYQYFAAQGLRLQAPEVLREALEKSDYGERVHYCLEAFHSNVAGLPGPFPETITTANRSAAIEMLSSIARQVFAKDLEDNFQHRGWLKRWLKQVPHYIDWQIQYRHDWRVLQTEQRLEHQLTPTLAIKGRLDRIDQQQHALGILDYKTGGTPNTDDVLAGEAVQLPFYALLAEQPVIEVAYLKLDDDPLRSGAELNGEELATITAATRARLLETHQAITQQSPLPAWGDHVTCHYCDMRGLCRKDIWDG